MFTPKISPAQINSWAAKYSYPAEAAIEQTMAPQIRQRGYVLRNEFVHLCDWKSPRIRTHCQSNDDDYIESITGIALSTANERLRIEILMLLKGVSWPMASVILHWCHAEPYPILDFRALWTLGIETPPRYNFDFWWAYTEVCRQVAQAADVSMRVLDRALWTYSKEMQGAG